MVHRSRFVTAAALAAALAAPAVAQSRNVTLLSNFSPSDAFNDVWGYVDAATGREFALLGSRQGTYFVETTDPARPVQKGWFPASLSGWSPSTWRDIRTYGSYAYVVTESGGGMQILDLSNPDSPSFVTTFRPAGVSWGNTHNVSIDLESGVLYAVGTQRGTHLFDLTSSPTNPSYITSYTSEYVHDLQVQNGMAYSSEINRGILRLLDVSSLPTITTVGICGVTAAHQAWPSEDGTILAGASEAVGGFVTVFDLSNQLRPPVLSTYQAAANPYATSVHNVFMKQRIMHCAWYMEGYVGVDLSDPRNPVEVSRYDTLPGGVGVFEGAWGCYPFQPSGNVYISDRSTGLYVLRPRSAVERYGVATPGTSGAAPVLHPFGAPWLGTRSFQLEVRGAQPGARVFFLVGAGSLDLQIAGHNLVVDIAIGGVAESVADARGVARTALPLPNDPGLDGAPIYVQALCADATAPIGYASSAGMVFRPFPR